MRAPSFHTFSLSGEHMPVGGKADQGWRTNLLALISVGIWKPSDESYGPSPLREAHVYTQRLKPLSPRNLEMS